MATKEKSDGKKSSEPLDEQVSFYVEPGTKVKITLEVGEEVRDGRIPLTVHIEQVGGTPNPPDEVTAPASQPLYESVVTVVPAVQPAPRWEAFERLQGRLKTYDMATWLFICAVVVYLGTRLIGLTQFPIYFFTDEAIQSQSIVDLMNNGYKDPSGKLFPTYFQNGKYYNIGVSVYLQWLPAILFGKSALVTRATSVLVTLIAAISIGILLRDVFKLKYWWTGTLLLSITPAWFLHSRTAFETVEFVAFYAGTLCAYLFYRYRSTRYLYLTILLGAISFYTYSPAQVIVPLTALGLLILDWRYHWEKRRTVLTGLVLGLVLTLPYIRFNLSHPNVAVTHLHTLWSYWFENTPLSQKIAHYLSEFGVGLSPWYWYVPNNRDLSRHLMKNYGNIMMVTLPFALVGTAYMLRNLRSSAYRTIFISLLLCPAASALVQISITRTLVFVVPAAILTAIGLDHVLQWIEDPKKGLGELSEGPGPTPLRAVVALSILVLGIFSASFLKETINGLALWALVILLALQISGILKRLAQSMTQAGGAAKRQLWTLPSALVAIPVFIALSGTNIYMLNDSLRNGPLWFRDYGLAGMQYGAFQIFDVIEEYVKKHPGTKIVLSPDWLNGADSVVHFFLDDPSFVQLGSAHGYIAQKLPLDEDTLFIMTPEEYGLVTASPKLTDIQIEMTIPYPDGNPGFYFVRMRYADKADEIFAKERESRLALQETTLKIDGQDVKVRFSYLDAAEFQDKWIALVFDNDPFTVTKTLETNPFVLEMTFPKTRTINGFSIITGSAKVQITMKCYSTPDAKPVTFTFEGQGTQEQPELSFDLPKATPARILRLEVLDSLGSDQSKVHIWELKLR